MARRHRAITAPTFTSKGSPRNADNRHARRRMRNGSTAIRPASRDLAAPAGSPSGRSGRPDDRASGALRFGEQGAHGFGRAHIVGELDPGGAVTAERGP